MTQSNLDPLIQQIQNQQLEQIRAKRPANQDTRSKVIGAEAGLTKVRDSQGNTHWVSTNGNTGGIEGVAPELTRDAIAVPHVRPFDEPGKNPCCVISPQRKSSAQCGYIWLLAVDLNHYGKRIPIRDPNNANITNNLCKSLSDLREMMGQAFLYEYGGSLFHRNNQIVTDQYGWKELKPNPQFVLFDGEKCTAVPDIGFNDFTDDPYAYAQYYLSTDLVIKNNEIIAQFRLTKLADRVVTKTFYFSLDLVLRRIASSTAIGPTPNPNLHPLSVSRLRGGFFDVYDTASVSPLMLGLSQKIPYLPSVLYGNSYAYIQGDPLSAPRSYFLLAKDSNIEKIYGPNKSDWPTSFARTYAQGMNYLFDRILDADKDGYVQSEVQQRILNDLNNRFNPDLKKAWSLTLHEAWFVISVEGKRETTRKVFQALGYSAVPQFPGLPDEELLYPVTTFGIAPSCIYGSNIGQSLHPITEAPIPRGFTPMPSIIQNMEIFGLIDLTALNSLGVEPWQ